MLFLQLEVSQLKQIKGLKYQRIMGVVVFIIIQPPILMEMVNRQVVLLHLNAEMLDLWSAVLL